MKGNIWGADFSDIQLISKYKKGVKVLLCVTDIYSQFSWVFPFKKTKLALQLLIHSKKYSMNQNANQTKYG